MASAGQGQWGGKFLPRPRLIYFSEPKFPVMGCVHVFYLFLFIYKTCIQHCTVDHLARGSMKNAVNCVSECELQDT